MQRYERFEIANSDEKWKEWRLEAFIVETKNERGRNPAQILKVRPEPLD